MAQFSLNTHRSEPYQGSKFKVKWDGRYVAGISRVGALTRTVEVVQYRAGGDPSSPRKWPGQASYGDVELQQGVTRDHEFLRWINKVWHFGAALGAEVSLRDYRKDISLDVLNEAGQKVLSYQLYGCWPRECQYISELDASQNAVLIGRLVLVVQGIRLDLEGSAEQLEPSFTEPPLE
jgi:phage tail-like protein